LLAPDNFRWFLADSGAGDGEMYIGQMDKCTSIAGPLYFPLAVFAYTINHSPIFYRL